MMKNGKSQICINEFCDTHHYRLPTLWALPSAQTVRDSKWLAQPSHACYVRLH